MKKIISILLAVIMLAGIFTAMPITANAEEFRDIPARWNGYRIEFIEQPGATEYTYSVGIINLDGHSLDSTLKEKSLKKQYISKRGRKI